MGREVRRVPPGWEHPKDERGRGHVPLYDRSAEEAWADWQEEWARWLAGEHDRVIAKYGSESYPKAEPYRAFCTWHGRPPNPDRYRPHWPEGTDTAYQLYETVSEGTPVSPVFATEEAVISYLVNDGGGMGIGGRAYRMTRPQAEAFVRAGGAPSLIVTPGAGVQNGAEIFNK